MIHIKFVHTLLGLLSLSLFATLAIMPLSLQSNTAVASANEADIFLLLATSVANICLGLYINSHYGIKRRVQLFASTLIIVSAFAAVYTVFHSTYTIQSFTLQQITQTLLTAGIVLHFFINLNPLNPTVPTIETEDGREMGTVKWFNVSKGFGFITRDIGGDVFVHYRAIRGSGHRALREGQRVDFTVIENNKGLQAEDVIAAAPGG